MIPNTDPRADASALRPSDDDLRWSIVSEAGFEQMARAPSFGLGVEMREALFDWRA